MFGIHTGVKSLVFLKHGSLPVVNGVKTALSRVPAPCTTAHGITPLSKWFVKRVLKG